MRRDQTADGVGCGRGVALPALAHPIRASGRGLPWKAAPRLERTRRALLWSCQVKRPGDAA